MKNNRLYTTQLQAGLGLVDETRMLLELWQPGMKTPGLFQAALDAGCFPNVSARRLQNIVSECFAPRYLVSNDFPAGLLKKMSNELSTAEFLQLLFLFTARANGILADFVKMVYWSRYAEGHGTISNEDAKGFVIQANQQGKTAHPWSESTIRRISGYLTGCCADFGMLESGRKNIRKIIPFRIEPKTMALLAYDLHFAGIGDNGVAASSDWQLFGIEKADLRSELKRLALKGFFIIQTAGDVVRIGWKYRSWEELSHALAERKF